ncbi:hypothetical protein CLDAP_12720 [Caldilinea aerophila DSM 14535 = NBRC 104270]|uniref:Uncharacterized protein n=1 Tax=Caldilinea aerophila (strain DSM 14535 / JCM 11387 / NBRC 104270 / STL-6-O1) TaxID=926550 RepID=I0I224_CALAS|nr:hypothetical protein CLDAP_12720 [Caldilinea aerophila DSM 14535 = NBRC 104270]
MSHGDFPFDLIGLNNATESIVQMFYVVNCEKFVMLYGIILYFYRNFFLR